MVLVDPLEAETNDGPFVGVRVFEFASVRVSVIVIELRAIFPVLETNIV